ncbi:MAG: hypothetical protein LBO00_07160 [Zoogloeaceae bacterium]|nr:hypothetical protein [Zoogloeaceae bacterium]
MIEECRQYEPLPERSREDTLLRTRKRGAPIRDSLSIIFRRLWDGTGEGTHPTLHEIRSLAERLYREQGVDMQTLLGHKSPLMTAL